MCSGHIASVMDLMIWVLGMVGDVPPNKKRLRLDFDASTVRIPTATLAGERPVDATPVENGYLDVLATAEGFFGNRDIVSRAILSAFRGDGLRVAGMKQWVNSLSPQAYPSGEEDYIQGLEGGQYAIAPDAEDTCRVDPLLLSISEFTTGIPWMDELRRNGHVGEGKMMCSGCIGDCPMHTLPFYVCGKLWIWCCDW